MQYKLGDKRQLSARPLPGEGFAIPVTTMPNETTTVYTRMQNLLGDGLDTYFEVSSPQAYHSKELTVWLFHGFIFGGVMVMFLYNLVVYTIVRDRIYLWYLIYLFFAMMAFLAITGLASHFIWSHQGIISEAMLPILSSLTFISIIQFSRKFLETDQRLPKVDILLRSMMCYYLVPPFAFFVGYSGLAAKMIMIGCLMLLMLPILGFYLWKKGHRAALIFTMAWGVWFLAISMMASRMLGLLPTNEFTLRVAWLGILGEAVLFALALADRIRILRADKEAAEIRERAALIRSKAELEALVFERTQELATSHEDLRVMNNEKDKFFSIIAHDLRNPLNGVIGVAELLSGSIHEMSQSEVDNWMNDLRSSAANLYKLLENLLSWSMLQRDCLTYTPEKVLLDPLIGQCIALNAQSAQQKKIEIRKTGTANLSVEADVHMLDTVIRNLVSNAIKYSRAGSAITIETKQGEAYIEIAIIDQGVGMDEATQKSLFDLGEKTSSPGTDGEPGTGLGLQLCKELIKAHRGKLTVESKLNIGSTFRVILNRVTSHNNET